MAAIGRILGVLACLWWTTACVSATAYRDADRERKSLREEVEKLRIEREAIEEQFVDAQESYEEERLTRSEIASRLDQVQARASNLDETLAEERDRRRAVAAALAIREAELAKIQSTYDGLVTDLEAEVSAGQIEIERLREGLRLNVSDDVLFALGSARLDRVGRTVLEKVAGQLVGLKDFVEVRGHTDDLPIGGALARVYPSNWELAAARASSVVRLLESKGVPGERLAAVSMGPHDPKVPNTSAENRALNRRIEIRLLPRGDRGAAPAAPPVAEPEP